MVEEVKERDILSQVRHLFVGDDTGLLKKVKLTARKQEREITTKYGGRRTQVKRRRLSNGEEQEIIVEKKQGVLGDADNQTRVRYETEVKFKLLGKYLEQKKYQGVECASWSLPTSSQYISLLRGKSNIVQVFDSATGEVEQGFDLSS